MEGLRNFLNRLPATTTTTSNENAGAEGPFTAVEDAADEDSDMK